jgi:hypothetical protein
MTNRTNPGPGIGPTWQELIDSGEFERVLEDLPGRKKRKPTEPEGPPIDHPNKIDSRSPDPSEEES